MLDPSATLPYHDKFTGHTAGVSLKTSTRWPRLVLPDVF